MKMSRVHYEALRDAIKPLIPAIPAYREALRNDSRVKDLDTRLTFDVYYASKIQSRYSYQEWNYLDAHIYTATKKAIEELSV
jgi:hypothetical protein